MRKRVYDYLKIHPQVNTTTIAEELDEKVSDVLKAVNSLSADGYAKICSPVTIGLNNDHSCYYSVTGKAFTVE